MISTAAAIMVWTILIKTKRRRWNVSRTSSNSVEELEAVDEALLVVGLSGSGSLGPGALEWSMSMAVR